LPNGLPSTCEAIAGNALNRDDVNKALEGVDVVVQALGIVLSPKMPFEPVSLFSDATKILVPAMEEMKIPRLISVTGFGAGDSKEAINIFQKLPFHFAFRHPYGDKSIQEDIIENSNLDWLIVRPGVLTNGRSSGRYKVLTDKKSWRNGIIARADVADFIVSNFGKDGLSHAKPVLIRFPL
ncbi:MAG: NAD(P)-binding oxidoreductase, partial [Pseudomonadota bacterium]